MCVCVCVCVCVYYMYIHIHTYIRTCIHTYIHTWHRHQIYIRHMYAGSGRVECSACSVCLEDMLDGDALRRLECCHTGCTRRAWTRGSPPTAPAPSARPTRAEEGRETLGGRWWRRSRCWAGAARAAENAARASGGTLCIPHLVFRMENCERKSEKGRFLIRTNVCKLISGFPPPPQRSSLISTINHNPLLPSKAVPSAPRPLTVERSPILFVPSS